MVSLRFFQLATTLSLTATAATATTTTATTIALSLVSVSALTNPNPNTNTNTNTTPQQQQQSPRFSNSDLVALSQGEASLLGGSSNYNYNNGQPLWSGKKNNNKKKLQQQHSIDNQSGSFAPRTPSNQSSFVQK